jgi:hypothetical protein
MEKENKVLTQTEQSESYQEDLSAVKKLHQEQQKTSKPLVLSFSLLGLLGCLILLVIAILFAFLTYFPNPEPMNLVILIFLMVSSAICLVLFIASLVHPKGKLAVIPSAKPSPEKTAAKETADPAMPLADKPQAQAIKKSADIPHLLPSELSPALLCDRLQEALSDQGYQLKNKDSLAVFSSLAASRVLLVPGLDDNGKAIFLKALSLTFGGTSHSLDASSLNGKALQEEPAFRALLKEGSGHPETFSFIALSFRAKGLPKLLDGLWEPLADRNNTTPIKDVSLTPNTVLLLFEDPQDALADYPKELLRFALSFDAGLQKSDSVTKLLTPTTIFADDFLAFAETMKDKNALSEELYRKGDSLLTTLSDNQITRIPTDSQDSLEGYLALALSSQSPAEAMDSYLASGPFTYLVLAYPEKAHNQALENTFLDLFHDEGDFSKTLLSLHHALNPKAEPAASPATAQALKEEPTK